MGPETPGGQDRDLQHTVWGSAAACPWVSHGKEEPRAALTAGSPEQAAGQPALAPGPEVCPAPCTVTLQNSGAAAVMTMAGPGGSKGARLGAALLRAERRARLSRTEESQGRPAATAMAESEDRSIHTQHISAVHNVPMRVLIRPIPAVLEPGKVQSLMETLQVSTTPGDAEAATQRALLGKLTAPKPWHSQVGGCQGRFGVPGCVALGRLSPSPGGSRAGAPHRRALDQRQ